MIKGIGLDIVEINRISTLADRQPRFLQRILTDSEMEELSSLKGSRKAEFLAGRFAAKEAFAKAKGTGIGSDLSFTDIEIKKDPLGQTLYCGSYRKRCASLDHPQQGICCRPGDH